VMDETVAIALTKAMDKAWARAMDEVLARALDKRKDHGYS
jgi:hypothetical protein